MLFADVNDKQRGNISQTFRRVLAKTLVMVIGSTESPKSLVDEMRLINVCYHMMIQHLSITKTCPYNFYPLKPHFYKVKLAFTGVYIIFLVLNRNHRFVYSLEPPQRGDSNKYPQSMFSSRNMEFFI